MLTIVITISETVNQFAVQKWLDHIWPKIVASRKLHHKVINKFRQ
jgi:uncharacterized protein YbjQ (UPF0145 family)